ncbi:MAG: hypothetical protein II982_02295, partial [Clostridia bacterium]|nr:hypothetical protein [Clostridia bacterium]
MKTCTFFGHRDTPKEVEFLLRDTIENLIQYKNVNKFYVGNQGNFDVLVRKVLIEMKKEYPEIQYNVVLAYIPTNNNKIGYDDFSDTILPQGIEEVHRKIAILWRNKWMLSKSDYVVTYVGYTW